MIRQTAEMAHPMYDIICKASPSTLDMSCKNISSNNDGITINTCTNVMTPTTYWQTCSPPATSTSTAKLVRWVLRHCTDVTLPSVLMPLVVIPSDAQPPCPTLCHKNCFNKVKCYIFYCIYLRFREIPVSTCKIECVIHLQNAVKSAFILTSQYMVSWLTYQDKVKTYWDGIL